MNIFWLQQAERDVPVDDQWLTPDELNRLRGLGFPQRRRDWRLGRWTAKCAVASYLEWPSRHDTFTDIEVRTAPSGAPEVLIQGTPGPVVISLSHRVGVAICAVAPTGAVLGCDLEKIEPRSQAFISDYFTAEEQIEENSRAYYFTSPCRCLCVGFVWLHTGRFRATVQVPESAAD